MSEDTKVLVYILKRTLKFMLAMLEKLEKGEPVR